MQYTSVAAAVPPTKARLLKNSFKLFWVGMTMALISSAQASNSAKAQTLPPSAIAAPAPVAAPATPTPALPAVVAKPAPFQPTPVGTSSAAFIPGTLVSSALPEVMDGPQLAQFEQELKKLFPTATSFKQSELLPLLSGGTSFIGLVGRLLGEGFDMRYEGIKTRRFMYQAFEKELPLGIAHGSIVEAAGRPLSVFVFYTAGGTIREVRVAGNDSVAKELADGGYLKQFEGYTTEDFEMIRGKRKRIRSKGAFFAKARRPASTNGRAAFEKVFRAVRYNAAFMDVAYFITQHPDLADKPVQEFPDEVEVTTGAPSTGPEAYSRSEAEGKGTRSPATEEDDDE